MRPPIEDIEKLIAQTTEGPWLLNKYGSVGGGEFGTRPITLESGWQGVPGNEPANLRFAAHARQDIPALLAYVKELEAQIGRRQITLIEAKERKPWGLEGK